MTAVGIAFLGVSVPLLTTAPSWIERSTGDAAARVAVSALRWPVLLVVMMAVLALVYRYAPNRPQPRWRWVSAGPAIATVIWLTASIVLSVYASHVGSFNRTYGSLAAVVVLMLWLDITMLCVLLGAEIDAELERGAARGLSRGPTRGPAKPPDPHEAYLGDEVGVAQG